MAYTFDIPITSETHLSLFADDTMLHTSSINIGHAVNKLQVQLELLIPWLDDWKLSLNHNKTVAMKFGKRLKNIGPMLIHASPWSTNTSYLGVYLDSYLNFNFHTSVTANKARNTRAALYPLFIHLPTKINIYKMYVRTKITYANSA